MFCAALAVLLTCLSLPQVLVKIADPSFIGFVAERKVDCANKVVLRVSSNCGLSSTGRAEVLIRVAPQTDPAEKVGAMCLKNGKPLVVEYSEFSMHVRQIFNRLQLTL